MKTLVVYDSQYGNTESIAKAIGAAIPAEVQVLRVGDVNPSALKSFDLLIIGSPTQGGRPTQAIQSFLEALAPGLKGASVAAFDTRLPSKLVGIFGYAAERIARSLKGNGGILLGSPAGFVVKGKDGPLADGEVERAARWAQEVVRSKE
jgi:flavodoxin I